LNTYVTHYYECDNGMEFGIRSDDGKVVFMSLTNKDFYDTEPYIEDVENCKEAGKKQAFDLIRYDFSLRGVAQLEHAPSAAGGGFREARDAQRPCFCGAAQAQPYKNASVASRQKVRF